MRISPLFLALALVASVPAYAADAYVGVGISQAPDGSRPGANNDVDTDPYARLYGGMYVSQGLSVELAYHDFGRAKFDGVADFGFDVDTKGWSAGVRYEYGDAAWAPYTKIGYFTADTTGTETTILGPHRIDESQNGVMIEGGVRWTPNDKFSLRGGYEWFDFDGGGQEGLTIAAEFAF